MRDMIHFHDDALEKTAEESEIIDIRQRSEMYPNRWGVLLDDGYVGVESEVRAIIPKKKACGGVLMGAEKRENAALATNRIIVENDFGRHGTLWAIIANRHRWAESGYHRIFRMTVALTNIHISNGIPSGMRMVRHTSDTWKACRVLRTHTLPSANGQKRLTENGRRELWSETREMWLQWTPRKFLVLIRMTVCLRTWCSRF